MADDTCGGCAGLGSHRRYCPRHPDFHPWRLLADRAEDIGDSIGGTDPGLANRAYALAGAIRAAMPDHPWHRPPTTGMRGWVLGDADPTPRGDG